MGVTLAKLSINNRANKDKGLHDGKDAGPGIGTLGLHNFSKHLSLTESLNFLVSLVLL